MDDKSTMNQQYNQVQQGYPQGYMPQDQAQQGYPQGYMQQGQMQQGYPQGYMPQGQPMQGFIPQDQSMPINSNMTKKEFLQHPYMENVRKELKAVFVIYYIIAGINFVVHAGLNNDMFSAFFYLFIYAGCGLYLQLTYSIIPSLIIGAEALFEIIVSIVVFQQLPGWLIILAAVFGLIYSFQLQNAWKIYQNEHYVTDKYVKNRPKRK